MDTTCMLWQVVIEHGLSVNLDSVPMQILYGHTSTVTSVDLSNELDIVVSAAVDGTVNMHTIRTGSYVRTLSFVNEKISVFRNLAVKMGDERHILVYVNWLASSLADNEFSKVRIFFSLFLSFNKISRLELAILKS